MKMDCNLDVIQYILAKNTLAAIAIPIPLRILIRVRITTISLNLTWTCLETISTLRYLLTILLSLPFDMLYASQTNRHLQDLHGLHTCREVQSCRCSSLVACRRSVR